MAARDVRRVDNQVGFRRANERLIERVRALVGGGRRIPFLCECAAVRADESRFVIARGHATIAGEEIVAEHEQYAVVEKTGRSASKS
jgi:hypothetical protein